MKVLVLCTGNSCRSILCEALLNHIGQGRIAAFSAGSQPTGNVHPFSLQLLETKGLATRGLRSKSWDEFAGTQFDIVITVCDSAAGEVCPLFAGTPVKTHWGVPDPAHAKGSEAEIRAVFESVYQILKVRAEALLQLPSGLSKDELSKRLDTIGAMTK